MTHSFDVRHAQKYGVTAAILIQNFTFWILKNRANRKNLHDGRTWTYNSQQALLELFPYMSRQNLRTALKKLTDDGVLMTGNYNTSPYDQTLWYAFVDEAQISTNRNPKINQPIPDSKPDYKPDTKKIRGAFAPPTLSEVSSYCAERCNTVDPERFIDFYASKGWMVGKNKMKDWMAAVRNWERGDKERSETKNQPSQGAKGLAVLEEMRRRANGGMDHHGSIGRNHAIVYAAPEELSGSGYDTEND